MLKKTITYETYDGNKVTEDFYFNLSKAELIELEITANGSFAESLQAIIKSENGAEIISTFKKIVLMAVGRKSDDGKRFIKNDDIRDSFMQTEAYSDLFIELATDAQAALEFVKGIVPAGITEDVNQQQLPLAAATDDVPIPEVIGDNRPTWLREGREPTDSELRNMPREEIILAMQYKQEQGKA